MKKTKNWFQAVIETASNNYFVELVKKPDYKYMYTLKAYTEGDEVENDDYYIRWRVKKSDFIECIEMFFKHILEIKKYSLMDY